MIYYKDNDIVIRSMQDTDVAKLYEGIRAQGWEKPKGLYEKYLKQQGEGVRFLFVAQYKEKIAGYTCLIQKAGSGAFAGRLPEICDFNVFEPFRRKGIGNRILDAAENKCAEFSDVVSLGVGMHPGYGPAQRIYAVRGYIPDGSGVWYQGKQLGEGAPCVNDDDLILYFTKQLK